MWGRVSFGTTPSNYVPTPYISRSQLQLDEASLLAGECSSRTMVRAILDAIRAHQPQLRPQFLTIHYAYFIGLCLLTSIIFWGASTPARSVRYIDALFFTVSATTEAGLNTVNLSTLNVFQQVILFFSIIIGSTVRHPSAYPFLQKSYGAPTYLSDADLGVHCDCLCASPSLREALQ